MMKKQQSYLSETKGWPIQKENNSPRFYSTENGHYGRPPLPLIKYKKLEYDNEILELSKLRWRHQKEEGPTLGQQGENKFVQECFLTLQSPLYKQIFTHFGAFEENKLVAVASINSIKMIPRPHRIIDQYGYLTNVYTIPEMRNLGIMSYLLDHIKHWAIENDFEIIIVWPSRWFH